MFDKKLLLQHITNIPTDITEQNKAEQYKREADLRNAPSTKDAIASGDMNQLFLALDADKRFGRVPRHRRHSSVESLKAELDRELYDPRTGKEWEGSMSKDDWAYRKGFGTKESYLERQKQKQEQENKSKLPDGVEIPRSPHTGWYKDNPRNYKGDPGSYKDNPRNYKGDPKTPPFAFDTSIPDSLRDKFRPKAL